MFRAFLVLSFGVSPFVLFPLFFFLTRTSRLAPMALTLLGGLEQATFKFLVVASRLFLVFCVCPNFEDLAKQRRKVFWGVPEVGKNDFSVYFCRLCVFFWVFFSLLRPRATPAELCNPSAEPIDRMEWRTGRQREGTPRRDNPRHAPRGAPGQGGTQGETQEPALAPTPQASRERRAHATRALHPPRQ